MTTLYGYKKQKSETGAMFMQRAIVGRWNREGVTCTCPSIEYNYPRLSDGSEWHLMGCPVDDELED